MSFNQVCANREKSVDRNRQGQLLRGDIDRAHQDERDVAVSFGRIEPRQRHWLSRRDSSIRT